MTLPSQSQIDIVATRILLDANEALKNLAAFGKFTTDSQERLQVLKRIVTSVAEKMNGDFKKATAAVREFSGALTGIKAKEVSIAGKMAAQEAGRVSAVNTLVGNLRDSYNGVRTQAVKAGQAGQQAGKQTENGFTRALTAVNAVRIAMGVLVSMLIFQVLQAFGTVTRTIIAGLKESELAVYNLVNAERRLSEQGADVTPKGLKETIEAVQELVPILSKIQIQELVSRVATNVAPALKFTNEQIKQMSESVALLYVRNKALGYSFDEVEKAITDAFLTGKVSQGINKFGVKLSDQIVKDEALRLGLVKTEEEFNNLTGEMEAQIKASAMLSVVYKNASQDVESLGEYMQTADAQMGRASAAWTNLLTQLGEILAPVAIDFFHQLANVLETFVEILESSEGKLQRWVARFTVFTKISRDPSLLLRADPRDMFAEIMDSYNRLENAVDTPTGDVPLYDALEDTDEAEKSLDDLREKIQDVILDAQQAREDLDLKFSQKLSDLDVEYDRKKEDAARSHQQKLSDINQDALDKIEDAKRKAREDEKKAEQDLLQKLKELRQRFLMDLEDALHERDARQVLRLIREYNLEKQNILDRKKLDDQQRKDKLAADLRDIELERQRKIEQEKIEYQRKLEDLALSKKREREELNLWYQREQEDIQRNIEQKLQKLLNGYITEGQLHESQLSEIEDILSKHFGNQMGMVDRLVAYARTRFAEMYALAATPISAPAFTSPFFGVGGSGARQQNALGGFGGSGATLTSTKNTRTPAKSGRVPAFGDGGTLIARQPTLAMFGEKTPEIAHFTPLNKLNTVGGGEGGMVAGGELGLEVMLSPDLEARIVKNTMAQTGKVITKIRRSK